MSARHDIDTRRMHADSDAAASAAVTWEDYARAESFLPWNVARWIARAEVEPHFIGQSDRFWYRVRTHTGHEFVLVDPAAGTREPAFDHARLAAELSRASGASYVDMQLPFQSIEFVGDDLRQLRVDIGGQRWTCDLTTYACTAEDKPADPAEAELRSPDGAWAAFTRDHNLWLRELANGVETQITTDGEPHNAYGAAPEGRTSAVTERLTGKQSPPKALWSPDSSKLAVQRLDEREVLEMHLIQAQPEPGSFRPRLHSYRYPLVGDEQAATSALAIVDVAQKSLTWVASPPLLTPAFSPFDMGRVWWTADSAQLCFLDATRSHRSVALRVADAASGATRTVVEEHGQTYVSPSLSPMGDKPVAWLSNDGSEALWLSERDGWGHLYLLDGNTGAVTRQLTSGPWLVRELKHVDEDARVIYFTAGGRESGVDPLYRQLYRVGFDGAGLQLLSSEDADHALTYTPSGRHCIDVFSRVDQPPVAVLRTAEGQVTLPLEQADITPLLASGWSYPERFCVKARDGVTDLYGTLIKPSTFDPARSYPVLDGVYPGPQHGRVEQRFPDCGPRAALWHDQALAELGFVVFSVDGLGTPYRSKAFHDQQYGKLEEGGGLADHIAALRQLAASRPYLDLSRVGIYGHSGGGYASVRAMLAYPEFYKVAVSSAGNHDQRGYLSEWGELYVGPLEEGNYDAQANASLVCNLRGKLLLAWGELDDNVHPALTIQLINALIAANKDFDLLVIPNANHAFADLTRGGADTLGTTTNNLYFIRRKWDYFVTHLRGAQPPEGYRLREPASTW